MLKSNNGAQTARIKAVLRNTLEVPDVRGVCTSLMCTLGNAAKVVAGGAICLFGIVLVLTLWLMPLGLVLAFLGTALMLARNEST